MSMKALNDIRDMLCEELDEISKKTKLSAGDLEIAHKLTDTIKNIDKIEMLEDNTGYSQRMDYPGAGEWEADMRGVYSRDNSYRGRKRDAMGRYSRADGRHYMRDQLEGMMQSADDDRTRNALRKCINQLDAM